MRNQVGSVGNWIRIRNYLKSRIRIRKKLFRIHNTVGRQVSVPTYHFDNFCSFTWIRIEIFTQIRIETYLDPQHWVKGTVQGDGCYTFFGMNRDRQVGRYLSPHKIHVYFAAPTYTTFILGMTLSIPNIGAVGVCALGNVKSHTYF